MGPGLGDFSRRERRACKVSYCLKLFYALKVLGLAKQALLYIGIKELNFWKLLGVQ